MAELEEALDMSLAELIKRNNKKPPPAPRPFEQKRSTYLRPVPENFRPVLQMPHSGYFNHFRPPVPCMNQPQRFGMRGPAESQQRVNDRRHEGSKLFVSNLDSAVTHQDLQVDFSFY